MAGVSATVSAPAGPARTADLFAPGLRGLTLGLVSTITLVALESLAIGTVMPMVADDLGDLALYGWVYSAFFLGSLVGIVVAGGGARPDAAPPPVRGGPRAVRARAADRRARAVDAGPRRRPLHPGPGRRRGRARRRTSPSAAACPSASSRACSRCCRRPGSCPGSSARASRPSSARSPAGAGCSWACCRCSLLAGGLALTALRRVAGAGRRDDRGARHGDRASAGPRAWPRPRAPGSSWRRWARPEPALVVAGVVVGRGAAPARPSGGSRRPGRCCSPSGVPAAVLLRGVMTFAFFCGRRLHPAAAPDLARDARRRSPASCSRPRRSRGPPARGSRRAASTATARASSSPSGFALHRRRGRADDARGRCRACRRRSRS